ncbi:MAG: DUF4129 domain-containing protein [Treponemataceae bacterium]|nr:DUF4129 domain-containing protein [Treponemataceae bacterium]
MDKKDVVSPERQWDRSFYLVHPLISFLQPFSTLGALLFMGTYGGLLTVQSFVVMLLVLVVTGIESVVVGNILYQERASWTSRFRELLLISMLVYSFFSIAYSFKIMPLGTSKEEITGFSLPGAVVPLKENLPRELSFLSVFLPRSANVFPLLVAMLQWTFTTAFHSRWRNREAFLRDFEGLSGETLINQIREQADFTTEIQHDLKALRLGTLLFGGVFTLVVLLFSIVESHAPWYVQLFLLVLVAFFPFTSGLIGIYGREQYDAGAGFPIDDDSRRRQQKLLFWSIAFSFVFALLCTGKEPLFPLTWLESFFRWLARLFPERHFKSPSLDYPELPLREFEPPPPPFTDIDHIRPLIDLSWLIPYLKWGLIIGGIVLVVVFLFAPLRSRSFWRRLRKARPIGVLKDWFLRVLVLLRRKQRKKLPALPLDEDNLEQVRHNLEELIARRKNPQKKHQMGYMVRLYLRFIRWGEETWGLRFTPTTSPGDYAEALIQKEASLAHPVRRFTELFEEALYADYLQSRGEMEEYDRILRVVLARKKEDRGERPTTP